MEVASIPKNGRSIGGREGGRERNGGRVGEGVT